MNITVSILDTFSGNVSKGDRIWNEKILTYKDCQDLSIKFDRLDFTSNKLV